MARKKKAGTSQSNPATTSEEAKSMEEAPSEPAATGADPPVDPALISSVGFVAGKCYGAVTEFTRGARWERFPVLELYYTRAHKPDLASVCACSRSKAKKALLTYAQDFPGSPLPNRYLVISLAD